MSRRRAATNRTGRPGSSSVSLFPFLAVLISTMGALILLLVVIARHARLQAAQAPSADASKQEEQIEADRELVAWRVEQLRASRDDAAARIADERLKLGQIEDHARQLEAKLDRLRKAWADLEAIGGETSPSDAMRAELEERKREIRAAERQLADARAAAAERQTSYAVVPYEGPNGTRRRPIYVECREDAVVLQPEEIVLTANDFDGPLGPGNPLDVALRARREYLLDQGRLDPTVGEPYPLLLVRPGGIAAYSAAREALASWGSEFGYELIDADWKLAFEPIDPELTERMSQAVAVARARKTALAAATSRLSRSDALSKYRAVPYMGGAVPEGGRAGDSSRRPSPSDDWAQRRPSNAETTETSEASENSAADASVQPLAKKRGVDWALGDVPQSAVPITRPIRVDCRADRLTIVVAPGTSRGKEILIRTSTEDAVDAFVSSIHEVIADWGIAGHGMYWRPVLNVHVAPEAEARFAELQTLLEGSGLDVRRGEG